MTSTPSSLFYKLIFEKHQGKINSEKLHSHTELSVSNSEMRQQSQLTRCIIIRKGRCMSARRKFFSRLKLFPQTQKDLRYVFTYMWVLAVKSMITKLQSVEPQRPVPSSAIIKEASFCQQMQTNRDLARHNTESGRYWNPRP